MLIIGFKKGVTVMQPNTTSFSPQRPQSFWSAPRIQTSCCPQHQKSVIHRLIVKSDKTERLKIVEWILKNWDQPEVLILGAPGGEYSQKFWIGVCYQGSWTLTLLKYKGSKNWYPN